MIRIATLADVSRIAEISVYGWRNTYKNIVPDIKLFKDIRVDKSIERFSNTIIENKNPIFVFEDDVSGIIKAILSICDCRDEDLTEAYELAFIYVEKAFSRYGIGKYLLDYFEATGLKNKKSKFVIWCLKENSIGRSFYEKYGYKHDGTEKLLDSIGAIDIRYIKEIIN